MKKLFHRNAVLVGLLLLLIVVQQIQNIMSSTGDATVSCKRYWLYENLTLEERNRTSFRYLLYALSVKNQIVSLENKITSYRSSIADMPQSTEEERMNRDRMLRMCDSLESYCDWLKNTELRQACKTAYAHGFKKELATFDLLGLCY